MTQFRPVRLPQRDAIAQSYNKSKVAFFMDMRLGKTITVIRWAERRGYKKVLVVCPLSVVHQWLEELDTEYLHAINLRDQFPELSGWHVINYDLIHQRSSYSDEPWDCIILDESAVIRNPQTKVYKFLVDEFPHVEGRAILSGYPAPEGLDDLFCQFHFLHGHFMKTTNWWQFRHKYYNQVDYGWYPRKGTKDLIKQALDKSAIIMRRKDYNLDPGTIHRRRKIPLPSSVREQYNDAENLFCRGKEETKYQVVVQTWLAQLSGGKHKDPLFFELIEGELADEPVIVWFRYNTELHRIRQSLEKRGHSHTYITGEKIKPEERHRRISCCRDGKYRILLMQQAIGMYGLDFSFADTAIYFSRGYSGNARVQSLDRLIDVNKTSPVLIIDLVTEDTVDEDVLDALDEKHLEGGSVMRHSAQKMRERWEKKYG